MIPLWRLLGRAEQYPEITHALLEALEAGLWAIDPGRHEIHCIARPEIHHRDGLLHRENGPALKQWETGVEAFYWRGVNVPAYVICSPEEITVRKIKAERNAEIRRVMIERYGYARFMKDSGARKIAEDKHGILWQNSIDSLTMVEVVNGTQEPDGTYKHYWLRVPPHMLTPTEAVAWTYGLRPEQYKPKIRT